MFGSAHAHPRGTIWVYALVSTLPWSTAWAILAWRLRRTQARRPVLATDEWHAYLWLWLLASPVFFTLAGNILPTYVLPSLPAFALLVGEAWSRVAEAGREPAGTKYNALVMPVLMVLAVLFALPRIAPAYSHKTLVSEYMTRRESPAQELVYLGAPPLSAEFYASGKIRSVGSPTELDALVRAGKSDFFVLTDAQLAAMPGWRDRLVPIARAGRYQLLQPIAPAASRAP